MAAPRKGSSRSPPTISRRTVKIEAPADGERFVTEDNEWISITANATDDWAMDRVDFYLNGNKVGTSTVAPYSGAGT